MAQVWKLKRFDDFWLIGQFGERFGMNPDEVFEKTSFNTITKFAVMWMKMEEYKERFSTIYKDLAHDSYRSDTRSE